MADGPFFGGVGFARFDQAVGLRLRVSQPNRRGYRCATKHRIFPALHCTAILTACGSIVMYSVYIVYDV